MTNSKIIIPTMSDVEFWPSSKESRLRRPPHVTPRSLVRNRRGSRADKHGKGKPSLRFLKENKPCPVQSQRVVAPLGNNLCELGGTSPPKTCVRDGRDGFPSSSKRTPHKKLPWHGKEQTK